MMNTEQVQADQDHYPERAVVPLSWQTSTPLAKIDPGRAAVA
jgi:hypothetical protein